MSKKSVEEHINKLYDHISSLSNAVIKLAEKLELSDKRIYNLEKKKNE